MTYHPNVNPPNSPHNSNPRERQAQNRRSSRWLALDVGLSAILWTLPLVFIAATLVFPGTWIIVAGSQDCQAYPATCMEPYDILQELALGTAAAVVVGLAGTALCTRLRWPHLPVAVIGAAILAWTWIAAFGFAFS
ncbi:hypothetical protein ACFWUP_23620 [Nocardia sp. NPDC058658]|uniref:hypothetical protein n=1 Tax=Nocardia sp. NPDC058658 TaxID=3346580 RepID=UPI003666B587